MDEELVNMEKLYIIGNGFDKHHGIPSGYWDFHNWLLKKDKDLVEQIDVLYGYNDDLWGNFEVELGNLNIEETATKIYRDHPADEMSDHYERTFHEGAIVASDTIGEVYNKIRNFFREWVKSLGQANPQKMIKIDISDSFFITFNYTDTLLDLYKLSKDKVLFIHGRAAIESVELVLGHGKSSMQIQQEAEKNFNEDTHSAYMQTVAAVEQQVNKMRKHTKNIIETNKAIFDSLSDVKDIYVYGCSLTKVDAPYFEEIVNRIDINNVNWHVNAYDKDDETFQKECKEKSAFLQGIGIPVKQLSFCKLNNLRLYKDNPLI